MPVPPTWIKFHKSCENWRVDGVLDNTVLITIGLEKLRTKWSMISRLSMIVRVNVVLNRTVVVDSDWRFNNLCSSHLQGQSEFSVSRQLMVLNFGYWPDWSMKSRCYWSSVSEAVLLLAKKTSDVIDAFRSVYCHSWTVVYSILSIRLVSCPVVLSWWVLLDSANKSFVPCR